MDKNLKGIELLQEGKIEEAVTFFTEAIEENPTDPVAYINFGNVLLSVGENEKAEKFLKRAISLDGNAASAYYSLGNLYFNGENFDAAKRHLRQRSKKGWRTKMSSSCWDSAL